MRSVTERDDPILKRLEEDFFRLLEVDRQSPEFDRLYRRVDAALDQVLQPTAQEMLA